MVHTIDDLKRSPLTTRQGQEVGSLHDVYFDDEAWTVRYLVVRNVRLTSRTVLISPIAVDAVEPGRRIVVSSRWEELRQAPGGETVTTASRAWERHYHDYYGYPYYWAGRHVWGVAPTPIAARNAAAVESAAAPPRAPKGRELHLRSASEVAGYHVEALDGPIGRVDDFTVDGQSWTILDLLIDTSSWIGGRHLLLSRERVTRIDWPERAVYVDATRRAVAASPEYRHDEARSTPPAVSQAGDSRA